jgi:thymidylate kinase
MNAEIEIARLLDRDNICYCVIHGWKALPDALHSDIDIAIASQELETLEGLLRHQTVGQIVQLLQHESSCFYCILAVREDDKIRFIPVDVATDYRRDGHIFFTAAELLADRRQWNEFWVAAPRVELAYLLVKKVLKKGLPEQQRSRFVELISELGDEAQAIAVRLLGKNWGDGLILWVRSRSWNDFEANLPCLKKALLWQKVKHDPLNSLRYWVPELKRSWNRWRYPTGLFVAVLGPDGAGKSTLIQRLKEDLAAAFRRTEVFHLRPGVVGRKATDGPVTNPHGKPPHPLWLSLLKVPYYALDYSMGYMLKVRPKLVRSTLVLFDRHYEDLLMDPHRYRYGGPMALARLVHMFIPKPDLFLILDVCEERLLARKREVLPEEVRRQREAYRKLAIEVPNAVLLDGSLAPKEVARNASEAIVDYLHMRYLGRRHLWFRENGLETLNWLESILFCSEKSRLSFSKPTRDGLETHWQANSAFGWLALKDGRGYLIPMDSHQVGVNALRLYNAQNLKARVAKRLLTMGMRWGVAQPLLRKVQVLRRQDVAEKARGHMSLLEHLREILERQDLTFAISLGTPGLHRKPVIQVLTRSNTTLGYVKVGWNGATNALVRHEAEVYRRLSGVAFDAFAVPTVLYVGWWGDCFLCMQSTPEGRTGTAPQHFTSRYLAVLKELIAFHVRWMPLQASAFWTNLVQRIESTERPHYRHILQQGARRVEEWLGMKPLPFHLCHGDFAPWNARLLKGRLFLFDWEYADWEGPPGWDLFHFLVQTLWLLNEWSPVQIYKMFQRNEMAGQLIIGHLRSLGMGEDFLKPLLLLYVLEKLAFYAAADPENFQRLWHLVAMVNLCMYEKK